MKTWDVQPGTKWRGARRVTQALAFVAILVGPVLGGWQRGYRGTMSAWRMSDWDLPGWLIELLPDVPSADVYQMMHLTGGGTAADYLGIGLGDPVLGGIALLWGQNTWAGWAAWLIPILAALVFGRVFCGWFCPFGVLARGLDRLLSLLPFRHRGFELPRRRPLRWFVLGVALVAGAFGGEVLAVVFLPHALIQNAAYAALLLGGIGAVGGAFLGLLAVGLLFGPSLYCATICPTGAALGLLGRARRARVTVIDPGTCGSCALCHRACWLGLEPAKGDPGPDCDLCTRCFSACPRAKMVVRFGKTAAVIICLATFGLPVRAEAFDWDNLETAPHKPSLVLNATHETPDFTLAVTLVDESGSRFTLDTEAATGVELSVYVVQGEKTARAEDGYRASDGVLFEGPLEVQIRRKGGVETVAFDRPTAPISTPKRVIYRRMLDAHIAPHDAVVVTPIDGLFDEPIAFVIPETRPARDGAVGMYFIAALLVFGGLLSIALGLGQPGEEP